MSFRTQFCAVATAAWLLLNPYRGAATANIQYWKVAPEIVEARLKRYTGDDQRREAGLMQMFAEADCDRRHLSEQPVTGSTLPNVVCVLPGSSERTIVIGAHFDRQSGGGGVVDNWSGASLLPSLYQSLAFAPRVHTYIFVGFADAPKEAVGALQYSQHMTEKQVAATDAMVNIRMLGLGPAQVWASRSNDFWISQLLYVGHLVHTTVVTPTDMDQFANTDRYQFTTTDSDGFANRNIPSVDIHTLTQETWDAHIIDTAKDNLSAIQPDDYYQSYALLACYITLLDMF